MPPTRQMILRSIGRGLSQVTRFPWARRMPRESRPKTEPARYRCQRCQFAFRLAGAKLPCPECGGPVLERP
jgi:DNA-directed RNA polymerase subunit RPC12/RpoP